MDYTKMSPRKQMAMGVKPSGAEKGPPNKFNKGGSVKKSTGTKKSSSKC